MEEDDVVLGLKTRYNHLPPLLVSRSVERAKNHTELFDILASVPDTLPVVWDSDRRQWVATDLIKLFTIKKA